MTVNEFRYKFLPTLADGLNRIIKADKAVTKTIRELVNNLLLKFAISPELDLLKYPAILIRARTV